jgi:hypothetical protein
VTTCDRYRRLVITFDKCRRLVTTWDKYRRLVMTRDSDRRLVTPFERIRSRYRRPGGCVSCVTNL